MINYQIKLQPEKNTYSIKLSFIAKEPTHLLKLPTWIPGSYMIREFSKNITEIFAEQSNNATNNLISISCVQINKNSWLLLDLEIGNKIEVIYFVYAYDFGIRTAYLDHTRGYFNNSSLCLYVTNYENTSHKIIIENLPVNWSVATSLENSAKNEYTAKNYMELIDAPFELGILKTIEFMVDNTPHYLILSGTILDNIDYDNFIHDLQKICAYQIQMFGGTAPFAEYKFLLYLGGEIYTGLEHNSSTALMAPYYSVPLSSNLNQHENEEYIKLLGLISHEYFHSWNVKRIKPEVFNPYDLDSENYTTLLWWFEGVTSYYDDLVLYRTGIITKNKYLQIILDNINNVYKYAGVNKQSLANSSITSWIKYYRPDENTPNAVVSYYVKGAILAMCLDLYLRDNGKINLDSVMFELYKKWQNDGHGINEDELYDLISKYAGFEVREWLKPYVYDCNMLPFKDLLKNFGINLSVRQNSSFSTVGVIHEQNSNNKAIKNTSDIGCKILKIDFGYKILNIYENSIAAISNLAPNDVIIAINGIKLNNWERQIALYENEKSITLNVFRRETLLNIEVVLTKDVPVNVYDLFIEDDKKLLSWL